MRTWRIVAIIFIIISIIEGVLFFAQKVEADKQREATVKAMQKTEVSAPTLGL